MVRRLIAAMAHQTSAVSVQLLYLADRDLPLFQPFSPVIEENRNLMVRLIQFQYLDTFRKLLTPRGVLYWESDRF